MLQRLYRRTPSAWRFAILLIAALFLLGSAAPAFASRDNGNDNGGRQEMTPSSLRQAAENRQIGSAIGLPQLDTDPAYRSIAAYQFNSVTPENAMKWDTTEPQPGVFNFAPADEIVNFALQNGDKVHGHTLVWHNQLPSWVTSTAWTPAALAAALKLHIQTEVRHFRGKVYAWDVVNEVLNEDGSFRQTLFFNVLGPSYIADAFRWAHEADPRAKLYMNDYNIEGINAKSTGYFNLIKSLKAQGVPISGIGIQGHLDVQYGFPNQMPENIHRFTDQLGIQVGLTEMDVRMFVPPTQAEIDTQTSYYSQMVNACLSDSRCVQLTVWGFTDKYSWVPSVFTGEGYADIFDQNYVAKPAYWTILNDLIAADKDD